MIEKIRQPGFSRINSSFIKTLRPSQLLPGFTAGFISGVITIIVEVSFAALIFDGDLSRFVANGIGFTLFGAFVVILISTFTSSIPGIIAFPQDTPAVLMALVAAGISSSMPQTATAEETYHTVVMSIVLTSLLCGGFFLTLGLFRLGRLIRFIPYPVIGGFLAGTGWLLAKGGLEVMTDISVSWSQLPFLFQTGVLIKWLPGLATAVVLLLLLRRSQHFMVMPLVIFTAMGLFYLLTWMTKTSVSEASSQGWLLTTFQHETLWRPISFSGITTVHWECIWGQLDNIGIILLISVISLLFNISGLELVAHEDVNLNRELKVAGIANLAAGIGGSHTAYHTLSLSTLGIKMGSNSRFVGLFAALLCGIALWFGASILIFFPKFVLGGLILFLGLSFIVEWVYDAWFKLSKVDYFLVLFIFVIIGLFGFLAGVGVGTLTAVIIFTVNYSRIKVVNRTLSEVTLRSNVDRPDHLRQLLRDRGPQVYILKLQGFIFFGTAHTLHQDVNSRVHDTTLPVVRYVVFDFRRVTGLDGSAEISFMKIVRLAHASNFQVIFTNLSPRFQRKLSRAFTGEPQTEVVRFFSDLDHGIEWCENQLLTSAQASLIEKPLSFQKLLQSIFLEQKQIEKLMRYLEKREVERGSFLIRQGERAEYLYFVESGEFAAQLELDGEEPIRLRTMHAGAIFGEIALYLNIPRSVSIIAAESSIVYQLSSDKLKRMEMEDPELAVTFQNYVIRLLAERLVDLNRTLEALSD